MNKKSLKIAVTVVICCAVLFLGSIGFAAVTMNSVTPQTLPTQMSSGDRYFLSGVPYTFRINASSNTATLKSQWTQLTLSAGAFAVDINPSNDTVTSSTGFTVVSIQDNTVSYNNIIYDVVVKFNWNGGDLAHGANNVSANANDGSGLGAAVTWSAQQFGICSTVSLLNFSQNGDAGDGRVNPGHGAFNVTGTVVYNVPSAQLADKVAGTENTGITLLFNGANSGYANGQAPPDFSFPVPGGAIGTGSHTWRVRAAMSSAGGPVDSSNTLGLICRTLNITDILFEGGGGQSNFKSINIPGVQLRVNAQMSDGSAMAGNTTVTISDGTNTYNVVLANGATTGVITMDAGAHVYPTVTAGSTGPVNYSVTGSSGGAYDTLTTANISGTTSASCYWDNADPPGDASGTFTDYPSNYFNRTAYSLTFFWNALDTGAPDYDADFYTYRLYYKEKGTDSWKIVDRTVTSPVDYSAMGTIGTTEITVKGLKPLTEYDYYITAVDIFGNEVRTGAGGNALYSPSLSYSTIATSPSSIEVSITDGITSYEDSSFNNMDPSIRPLRNSALKVTLVLVTGEKQPESVNIILTDNISEDLFSGSGLTGSFSRVAAEKTGANTWAAYIPTTDPMMGDGKQCKFIIESVRGESVSYSDHNSELEDPSGSPAPVDPNDYEYTFSVSLQTAFKPWPVRILNNVITNNNPVAYPAYYLTDDAYVTIRVYDIKGRPVSTILDRAYRKGGQNIKERGWRGTNKARRKLGVGLYYIHFKAKRARDGKVILNKFRKVVMAK